ncbi:MAG: arylsulfotransferase family protein [Candidatus Electrothrix communis]|nr:MAG: arylsulfotransferase family protein [Candidatus Electrothrix communis]
MFFLHKNLVQRGVSFTLLIRMQATKCLVKIGKATLKSIGQFTPDCTSQQHVIIIACCALSFSSAFAAPPVFPVGVTIHNDLEAYQGYTIFTSYAEKRVILIDMDGNEVHTWDYDGKLGDNPKLLDNGNILTAYNIPPSTGQVGVALVELDWEGNIVWQFHDDDYAYLHHDFEKNKNGNYLILGARIQYLPLISPNNKIQNDFIIEVDSAGNIIWEWFTSDHFDQFGFSDEAEQIIQKGTQDLEDKSDIFHTNSIQYLPENKFYDQGDMRFKPGNILVSQRSTNIVFILDKDSGDIVWKLGPEDNITIGQHNANMIPKGYPGAGNILLFDNGGKAGYPEETRPWSRVIEINDEKNIQWEYSSVQNVQSAWHFYSFNRSGAQRLPNGNTLICEATSGRIFEVTVDGEIVWEYFNSYVTLPSERPIYRAYRVNVNWPEKNVESKSSNSSGAEYNYNFSPFNSPIVW